MSNLDHQRALSSIIDLYKYFDKKTEEYNFRGVLDIFDNYKLSQNRIDITCDYLKYRITGWVIDSETKERVKRQPLSWDYARAFKELEECNWVAQDAIKKFEDWY
jgi:hypothetical protein